MLEHSSALTMLSGYDQERVAHIFHMRDLWTRVHSEYDNIRNVSVTTCNCLLDVENNGIQDRLLWIAQEYTHNTPISLHEWGTKIPQLTIATWPGTENNIVETEHDLH